jgi:NitT/TauT family transport system permease protein
MRIRQELTPARRRLVQIGAVAAFLLGWFLLTLPVLPAPPVPERVQEPLTIAEPEPQAEDSVAPSDESAPADPTEIGKPVLEEGVSTVETSPTGSLSYDPHSKSPERPEVVAPEPPPGKRALIPATILPSPAAVIGALGYLHAEEGLVRSAAMSFYRITVAFLLAALVAIPLGIVMGSYPPIRNAIEPFSGPLRYLPISAVTGLFILLFGIEENMKIAVHFTGTVVYLLPIVVESIQRVDDIYLETAYTLGAHQWQAVLRVLVPAAWPSIFEACRVIYGIGWTYVILAELINAEYGLGHLIQIAYKRGHIDQAYALVLVILLLGILTNEAFAQAGKRLFAWREAT